MKIVVGYRGVNVGKDLLDLAQKRASVMQGQVFVVTSLPGGDKTTGVQIHQAEENLKEAGLFFHDSDVPVKTHLLIQGRTAGEDIVKFAEECGADEIIIGVKSRSKVGKLIFGSTAQYVILRAHCPVTTVK